MNAPQALNLPALPSSVDTDGAATPLDLIFIEGFTRETVIGIHDSELHSPQPLVIDVYAGVPRPRACDSDQIGDTIDYGVVRERLHRLMQEHGVQLLESFAETIATILLDEFGARWVRVKVIKPKKFDDVDAVGVMIERRAVPKAAPPLPRGGTVLQLIGAGMVPGQR